MQFDAAVAAMRLAFLDITNDRWTAGAHYYQNLFSALRSLGPEQVAELALVVWSKTSTNSYARFREQIDRVLVAPPPPPQRSFDFMERQRVRVARRLGTYRPPAPRESELAIQLRDAGVACLFTCWVALGENFTLPTLVWIPDLQHVHMPELFTDEEIRERDHRFARIGREATRVVVSSEDALKDWTRYDPVNAHKARVLPFVAQLPPDVYSSDPAAIATEYHLPKRFIYLPNQFWQHKNHRGVLDALCQLHPRYPELTVVCTGNPNDNRAPLYFGELLADINRAGLRERMIVLGWIPHAHMFVLMRQSLAVLQPSLFEGWSTTVEECKSLGKSLLLSDLPIHREQAPPATTFFDPNDANPIATALATAWETLSPGPDAHLEEAARQALPARTRAFGERYLTLVREVSANMASREAEYA